MPSEGEVELRTCSECGATKPLTSFNQSGNGTYRRHACRRCTGHNGAWKERRKRLVNKTSCEVCGATENLGVDHDHTTGEIRGVLCGPCNTALGMLHESISAMRGLIAYAEKHGLRE